MRTLSKDRYRPVLSKPEGSIFLVTAVRSILRQAGISEEQLLVVHNGPIPSCMKTANDALNANKNNTYINGFYERFGNRKTIVFA